MSKSEVTVNNNSPIQDYVHPDDHSQPSYEMTPGFKPFTIFWIVSLEDVAYELDHISNNRLKVQTSLEFDFRLITTSKNNFSEIHVSWPTT